MIVSKRRLALSLAMAMVVAGAVFARADVQALKLRATVVGAAGTEPLTIELNRWSTEAERAPLMAALAAPVPTQDRQAGPPAGAAAGRTGRAGRGGARGGAAAPPNPLANLTTAIKAAPTVGFVWTGDITGYSIKYSWHAPAADGGERIVLVTDRRLGANSPGWPVSSGGPADAEFTVLELRLDSHGGGEAKSSLHSSVVVDEPAKTLALASYASVPTLLKVVR